MRSRTAGSLDAGPRVATILVLRSMREIWNLIESVADVQHHLAARAAMAMFPKIHALPGTERELALAHRNRERGRGERGLDVAWHVVRPLGVVRIERIALGHEAVQPALEVALRRRIRVLLDHEARRGVPHENRAQALLERGALHLDLHLVRDLV